MTLTPSDVRAHSDTINALQVRIHETCKLRGQSEADKVAWQDACRQFHGFSSAIHETLNRVSPETLRTDRDIRAFVFMYLSTDPIYFRSGYRKELLLSHLNKVDLKQQEQAILREIILHRVQNRAYREFRRFCRFIPKIETPDFLADLRIAATSDDQSIRIRAGLALHYSSGTHVEPKRWGCSLRHFIL